VGGDTNRYKEDSTAAYIPIQAPGGNPSPSMRTTSDGLCFMQGSQACPLHGVALWEHSYNNTEKKKNICSPGCMSRLRFSISARVRQRAPHMPHMPTVGAFTYAHASHGMPNSMGAGAAEVGAATGLGRLLSFSRARRALCCRCCLDSGGGCQHGKTVAQRTPTCSDKHAYKACAR
jgi:hypothetical protein